MNIPPILQQSLDRIGQQDLEVLQAVLTVIRLAPEYSILAVNLGLRALQARQFLERVEAELFLDRQQALEILARNGYSRFDPAQAAHWYELLEAAAFNQCPE